MWFKRIFQNPLLILIVTLILVGFWSYQLSGLLCWFDYNTKASESLWTLMNNPTMEPTERIRTEEAARISKMYIDQKNSFFYENIVLVTMGPVFICMFIQFFFATIKKDKTTSVVHNEFAEKEGIFVRLNKLLKHPFLWFAISLVLFGAWQFRASFLSFQVNTILNMTESQWKVVNESHLTPQDRSHLEEGARQCQYNLDHDRPFLANLKIVLVLGFLLGLAAGFLPTKIDALKISKKKELGDKGK